MADKFIIKEARVIDPASDTDEIRDVAVCDGIFVEPATVPDAPVLRLAGKIVTPGLIDSHVHLRDPGFPEKEDIATATAAAAAGGFTSVIAMANTHPVIDNVETFKETQRKIAAYATVRILQCASITMDRKGGVFTDAAALKNAGVPALSDDGTCIQDDSVMREALYRARLAGIAIVDHCENTKVAADGVVNQGRVAEQLGVKGIPACAEELIVARNLVLASELNYPIILQHLSSAGSVRLLRYAHERGIPLHGEVTPHHLCLTEEACLEYGTNAKMNPPLRSETDRRELLSGLQEGVLDIIGSDHAPHTEEEKEVGFAEAPFGIIGLETTIPVILTELYHKKVLSLGQIIAKFTSAPATAFNVNCGKIQNGEAADLTVLDLEKEHTVDVSRFHSKGRNSPFNGWKCRGKAIGTMVGGRWVYREDWG
ncbi:MAG: dihydroorotase [Verrucomicrobiota bacterium]